MEAETMKRIWVAVLVAGLGAAGVGCSDDTSPSGSTIKIGMLAPFSGALEGFGKGFRNAFNLAASQINGAGGVLGRQIDTSLMLDTKLDATVAATAAQKLITDYPDLVAILGPAGSGEVTALVPILKSNKIVGITPSATSPSLTSADDGGFLYRTAASDSLQGQVIAKQALKANKKSAGVIYIDNVYGKGLSGAFKEAYEKAGGSVKNLVAYPELKDSEIPTYDFSAVVTSLIKDQPELLVLITYAKDGARMTLKLKDLMGAAYKPALMGCDGNYGSDFTKNADQGVIEGMTGTAPAAPEGDASFTAFSAAYKAAYGTAPEQFAEGIYDGVYLVALAITKGKAATKEAVAANLAAISGPPGKSEGVGAAAFTDAVKELNAGNDIDFAGASGDIDFDANGDPSGGWYIIWETKAGAQSVKERVNSKNL